MHFRELELSGKFLHHVNTSKGGVVKQSGTDVEGFQFLCEFSFLCVRARYYNILVRVIMEISVNYQYTNISRQALALDHDCCHSGTSENTLLTRNRNNTAS